MIKKLILISILIILTNSTVVSQTIPLDSVINYEGKTVTICSKVQGVFTTRGEKKTTYISFGNPYPNATFTAIIFDGNLKNFKYNPSEYLKDKNVCLTSKVVMYKGKPEMILTNEEEVKVE